MFKFELAEVGDKVFSIKHGAGKIIDIDLTDDYPITVSFATEHQPCRFTLEGKYFRFDQHNILFWSRPVMTDELPDRLKDSKRLEHFLTMSELVIT